MRRSILHHLAPVLASSATVLAASPARAGLTVHVEQDFAVLTRQFATVGFGFSGRVGYRIGLGPIWLAPEVGAGYVTFGDVDAFTLHPSRLFAGGRLGLGGFVQPQLYGHAGYGWLGGLGDVSFRGATYEVGGALDLQLLPLFGVGVHVGYTSNQNVNGFSDVAGSFDWVNFGVHAGLTF